MSSLFQDSLNHSIWLTMTRDCCKKHNVLMWVLLLTFSPINRRMGLLHLIFCYLFNVSRFFLETGHNAIRQVTLLHAANPPVHPSKIIWFKYIMKEALKHTTYGNVSGYKNEATCLAPSSHRVALYSLCGHAVTEYSTCVTLVVAVFRESRSMSNRLLTAGLSNWQRQRIG